MNLKNLLTLTIRVQDFNLVASKPAFVKKLRKLTLNPYSGMNSELDNFEKLAKHRKVDVKILTAYRFTELVAWALLSKEPSTFWFTNVNGFESHWGRLFQVYVHPKHRRQKIASELIKVARKKAGSDRLCICPHDGPSEAFFGKFSNFKTKVL